MKVICKKHDCAHESTELCPWCEPATAAVPAPMLPAGEFDGELCASFGKIYWWRASSSEWMEVRGGGASVAPAPYVPDPSDDSSLLGWGRND